MQIFDYIWMSVSGFALCAAIYLTNQGELVRPVIGILLRKKPLVPVQFPPMELFRLGNLGQPVGSMEELAQAYSRLEAAVQESWFRNRDRETLRRAYVFAHLTVLTHMALCALDVDTGWRRVLGLSPEETDIKTIKTAYRKLVMQDHPDRGGTGQMMPELSKAFAEAREELNFV